MKTILAILAVILSGCCTNVYIVTIEQPKEEKYTDTQTNKDNHSDRLILLRKAADESSGKAKKYLSRSKEISDFYFDNKDSLSEYERKCILNLHSKIIKKGEDILLP